MARASGSHLPGASCAPTYARHMHHDYADVMAAIDALMLAHSAEVHGGRTDELRAETTRRYAEVAQIVRAMCERDAGPEVPEDDPRLPIRRGVRRP